MFIHAFTITNYKGEVTNSYVYAKNRIVALISLELATGVDEYEIDYIGNDVTNNPMNYDETDSILIKSN